MFKSFLFLWGSLVFVHAAFCAQPRSGPVIMPNDRVVFLGDSNTYAGKYIAYLEAGVPKAFGLELINLGLSSETASGLSEPAHPFPRPCVLDRLDSALEKSKPNVVVACYGMNDGIYYPFSAERFEKYKRGMTTIIEKSRAAGAKVILMTPPPFDPLPLSKKGRLLPTGKEKYDWRTPYEDYDAVMKKYASWVMSQNVDAKIDLHSAMSKHLAKARVDNADYVMSGDGVHFDEAGHRFLSKLIANELGFPVNENVEPEDVKRYMQRQNILRDAWLTHVGHKRPGIRKGLPIDEATEKANALIREQRVENGQ